MPKPEATGVRVIAEVDVGGSNAIPILSSPIGDAAIGLAVASARAKRLVAADIETVDLDDLGTSLWRVDASRPDTLIMSPGPAVSEWEGLGHRNDRTLGPGRRSPRAHRRLA
jgi:hypothetical protein